MPHAVILLAAGQGSRMKSDLPKVLHPIAGAPMLHHAMAAAGGTAGETQTGDTGPERMVVVAGHGFDAVAEAARAAREDVIVVRQEAQNGTAHAADQARAALADFAGDAIVLFGDTPFVAPETLAAVFAARAAGADVVVLGFEAETPGGYGRLVTRDDGTLERIVEAKDATPGERGITLCNSGVMAADCATLFALISEVRPDNAQGEYYLTDIVGIARTRGLSARVVTCPEAETMGINSRADLAAAEAVFQARARAALLAEGVTMTAPETVFLSHDTVIGRDVEIAPNVVFGPGVTVETGARIAAFSHLEGCHVSTGSVIGPYARLRPGAEIGNDARIGNFVEIKNTILGEGAKVNHLSYIGDADVGARSNIGAGTITCNYDGVFKHRTEIGAEAFIGSNSALVAPVRIGAGALVGSGAVITRDVAADDLALARARQETKPGMGRRLMDRLRSLKAAGKRP